MNHFWSVFPHRHVVLPVIHTASRDQAIINTRVARGAGADGVFLINHRISDGELLRIHEEVVAAFPDWWIGVNCLGLSPDQVFARVSDHVAGVWVDNAMI